MGQPAERTLGHNKLIHPEGAHRGHPHAQLNRAKRELPGTVALEVDYAGSKGSHLPGPNQQIDQLPDEFLKMGAALQQQVPNPFFGLVTVGTLSNPTVARGQERLRITPTPFHTDEDMQHLVDALVAVRAQLGWSLGEEAA